MPLMPGMGTYPPVVADGLFYRALLVLGAALLGIILVWRLVRGKARGEARPVVESPLRRSLASALGALWLLDGLLQAQPLMVTRFVGGLLAPLLVGQPAPVASLIRFGMRLWGLDPIWWNVFATYLQLAIGVILLFSRSERLRRSALIASVVWAAVVWSAGEAFGSLFDGGGAFVGSPGSVLLYGLSALLLLAPASRWPLDRLVQLGRWAFSGYFLLIAFLQVWPANGWWRGNLAAWVGGMAAMPQPGPLRALLGAFAGTLGAHPLAWNAGLAGSALFLAAAWWFWPNARATLLATFSWTLAVWVLGQDLGALGGMGTDPNTGAVLLIWLGLWARFLRVPQGRTHTLPDIPTGES